MRNPILKTLWNALAITAIAFAGWNVFTTMFQQQVDAPPTVVTTIGPAMLERIQRVNKQIFVEHYNAVAVTREEVPESWLDIFRKIGIGQKFVVLVRGHVSAGFDLSQVSKSDIWVSTDGKRVQIILPSPKIFEEDVNLDAQHSQILAGTDNCPDLLCQDDLTAYKDEILPEAKKQLIAFAERSDILYQAAVEGKAYYEQLFQFLDVEEVRVIIRGY